MAERKFDYENIATIYKNMQNITGNDGDSSSIAGILHLADQDFHDMVDVSEEALFGDLAKQLLLDWENTSSNFPNFVTNFNNWATLVAQSAGNYSAFEQSVAGLKTSNPLGLTSNGATSNYIDSSFYNEYSNTHLEQYNTDYSNLQGLYQLTGVEYAVSDSQSLLKRHKIITGIVLGADILGIAWSALAASALIGAGGAGGATGGTQALPPSPDTPALPSPGGTTGGTPGTGGIPGGTTPGGTTQLALPSSSGTVPPTGTTSGAIPLPESSLASSTGSTSGAIPLPESSLFGSTGSTSGAIPLSESSLVSALEANEQALAASEALIGQYESGLAALCNEYGVGSLAEANTAGLPSAFWDRVWDLSDLLNQSANILSEAPDVVSLL